MDYQETDFEMDEEEVALQERVRMTELLDLLGSRLQSKVDEQVRLRSQIEQRWIEDLRQYQGKYSPDKEENLKKAGSSKVFANITRSKTNAAEARLSDMLFPTDDRNWEISPTPIPEMAMDLMDETPVTNEMGEQVMTPEGAPVEKRDMAAGMISAAKEASAAMQTEMDDQLNEAHFNTTCREVIRDAVRLGVGILKGPVVVGKTKKRWSTVTGEMGQTAQVLSIIKDFKPSAERVDPWDFFPDMSARKVDEAEFFFQRHTMNKRQLRALIGQPAFIEEQIKLVLQDNDILNNSSYINDLRSINGYSQSDSNNYELWEYHGEISKDDLEACGCEVSDDPLEVYEGVVWFVNGRAVKAEINMMETEERPFSVFCWEEDEGSIFGFGIPYLMRDAQAAINGAWRMILDNGGLSVGPQTIINRELVEPADGNWTVSPKKLWYMTDKNRNVHEAFGSFDINSHISELNSVLSTAKSLADEETSLPIIAQGEQGTYTRTATGMSLLMNSANVVIRRAVKNYDDSITKPFLTRLYDWNMQFSNKEEIKGDYFVDARGSSALLAKEIQAQNLIQMLQVAPAYGQFFKIPELLRKTVQSMQLDAIALVKTDEEIKQEQASGQQAPNKDQMLMQLEQQKMQIDMQIKQAELQIDQAELGFKHQQLESDREMQLMDAALDRDKTVAQIQSKTGLEQMKASTKHELFNKEAELKLATGHGI